MAAIVVFTLFGVNSGVARQRKLHRKRTAETVGTIASARNGAGSNLIYTYAYSVKGVAYRGEDFGTRTTGDNSCLKRVGKQGHVCHDPADPGSAEFYSY